MRFPNFLKENGTIGFVAPSFGCVMEPYHSAFINALKTFEAKGYKCVLGPNCYEDKGVGISNTPEACGKELNEMYMSDVDVIISCGGGELMCETLPYIDFEMIKNAGPKWYLGYSDNTNYTFLSALLADTASIYGSCAPTFGMEPWDRSLNDTWDLLTGKKLKVTGYDKWEIESLKDEEHPLVPYNLTEEKILNIRVGDEQVHKTQFHGRLMGGNLDILINLIGTPFDKVKEFNKRYEDDGIIWFLEACDLNVFQIRRALGQMKSAGWLDNAKGFIIGRPMHYDEPIINLDRHEAVISMLKDMKVPIIMDADLGHLPPAMPFITGAMADVKAEGNDISIEYELK